MQAAKHSVNKQKPTKLKSKQVEKSPIFYWKFLSGCREMNIRKIVFQKLK